MRILAAAPLAFALFTTSAIGEECAKLETQQELNECTAKELQRSEHMLGEIYKEIKNRLQDRPDAIAALEIAEEAWIVYRDTECLFASSGSVGGSVYSMVVNKCREDLTTIRTGRLKKYLDCKEGDTTCPVPAKQ